MAFVTTGICIILLVSFFPKGVVAILVYSICLFLFFFFIEAVVVVLVVAVVKIVF